MADTTAGMLSSQNTQGSTHIGPLCLHRYILTRASTSESLRFHTRVLGIVAGESRHHGHLHRDCRQAIRAPAGQYHLTLALHATTPRTNLHVDTLGAFQAQLTGPLWKVVAGRPFSCVQDLLEHASPSVLVMAVRNGCADISHGDVLAYTPFLCLAGMCE